jgi:hypothetical protein
MEVASGIVDFTAIGIKLSTTLYTFASLVSYADKDMSAIADDIALTSNVPSKVGTFLQAKDTITVASQSAIGDANSILSRCREAFADIENLVPKGKSTEQGGIKRFSKRTNLLWAYKGPRTELLKEEVRKPEE